MSCSHRLGAAPRLCKTQAGERRESIVLQQAAPLYRIRCRLVALSRHLLVRNTARILQTSARISWVSAAVMNSTVQRWKTIVSAETALLLDCWHLVVISDAFTHLSSTEWEDLVLTVNGWSNKFIVLVWRDTTKKSSLLFSHVRCFYCFSPAFCSYPACAVISACWAPAGKMLFQLLVNI